MQLSQKAQEVLRRLKKAYPEKGEFVHFTNPLELVVGTVLSAQCTDKTVNAVTKKLFQKYTTAEDYANADISTLEKEIYSTGFYKSKAKYLKGIGQKLVEHYHGEVPKNLDDLLQLPGVAKKTAHLIMIKAFGKPTGIAVDTHVYRLAPRIGLAHQHKTPEKVGEELEKLYKPVQYLDVNEYFIMHGRALCGRFPKCEQCILHDLCNSAFTFKNPMLG
jgi:endonuclease-3